MSDLDAFTDAELQEQASATYRWFRRLIDAMPAADDPAYPAAWGATLEQYELNGAIGTELARRFLARATIFPAPQPGSFTDYLSSQP